MHSIKSFTDLATEANQNWLIDHLVTLLKKELSSKENLLDSYAKAYINADDRNIRDTFLRTQGEVTTLTSLLSGLTNTNR